MLFISRYAGVLKQLNDETKQFLGESNRLRGNETSDGNRKSSSFQISFAPTNAEEVAAFLGKLSCMHGHPRISSNLLIKLKIALVAFHNSIGWSDIPADNKMASLLQTISAGKLSLLSKQLYSA